MSTWFSLVLLIPFSGLGILSENSLPGQPLYSYKRGIEQIVLGFQAFNKNAQAVYRIALVDRRFSETETLLTDNALEFDVSRINDLTSQIAVTRDAINSLTDDQERHILRAQLIARIDTYKNQLNTIQTQTTDT